MRFRPSEEVPYQLNLMLNNGLDIGDNFRGRLMEVVLSGEMEIEHGLGYTPMGYILLAKEGAGDVWAAQLNNWNSRTLFLASSATNLKVRLFVM